MILYFKQLTACTWHPYKIMGKKCGYSF